MQGLLPLALFVCGGAFGMAQTAQPNTCTISSTLVNSCGPWLGAAANNYSGAPIVSPDTNALDLKSQILYHESRVGRQVRIVHVYHNIGDTTFSVDEKYFAARANTYLLVAFKPGAPWSAAAGGNSTIDGYINTMAESVHELGRPIFLTIWHEPENDVSVNNAGLSCTLKVGATQGSETDYVNMWHHVRTLFDNHHNNDGTTGVTNVTWVMIYQGIAKFDPCMTNALWPGNSKVDWVGWDPYVETYGTGTPGNWGDSVSYFYNTMMSLADSTHSYKGRPWMLGEFGVNGKNPQTDAYEYYDSSAVSASSIKKSLDANTYPNIKAYIVFDENGSSDTQLEWGGSPPSIFDPTEQSHYNNFANDPILQ